jgi:hypothetical protein
MKRYYKNKNLVVNNHELILIKQALVHRRRTYLDYAKNRNDNDFLVLANKQKKIIDKLEQTLTRGMI